MSNLFNRIKKMAAEQNSPIMETYQPVSPGELKFWNMHVVVKHKDLVPGVTDQEHVFTGAGVEKTGDKRPLDKPIVTDDKPGTSSGSDIFQKGSTVVVPTSVQQWGEETDGNFQEAKPELTEDALSRLRVQRAKLKKKQQSGDNSVNTSEKLLSLNNQIRNLNKANKVRDEWAQAAERNLEK